MGVRVSFTAYGRPAAEALRAAVAAAKDGDPLSPVTVVVPANQVGVAARRLLGSGALGPVAGSGRGMAGVTFLTVYRLAELLGSAGLAGQGRRPVSTPVIAAALRAALGDRPGVFAPVAGHPATESALVAAYQELRDLEDVQLELLARRSARAADVVRLHHAARARLERHWYDEQDLVDAALAALGDRPSLLAPFGPFVVHLPQRLSRHGAALLGAAGALAGLEVVAGCTGQPAADVETVRAVRRVAGDEPVPTGAGAPGADLAAVVGPDRTRLVTCSDADEEVRAGVRAVMAAVRAGTPLDRIAVLYASAEPYARLAHEQLSAAGVEHNGASVVPLAARVAGRTLLGLLALPEAGLRREDVFAWLSGARVRHAGGPVPVTAWERLSRDAGVVAGRDHWDRLLSTYAADCTADAERAAADPDAPAWRAERLTDDARRAGELRAFVLGLADDLSAAAGAPRRWSDHARWARRHVDALLGDDRRRGNWPVPEQRAAERVERAVDRLERLDAVEGPVALDVFARTLELELEADAGRVGRMGEGVLLGSIAMGVGLDLDLVVVLGLAEGLFPSRVREDSLLPDHEREVVGEALGRRADAVERQHRDLLGTLAGARRQVLTVPRGDLRRSAERVPSRWVLDVAAVLSGAPWSGEELLGASGEWLEHVASFDAGLRHMTVPADDQEYRLRALLAAGAGTADLHGAGDPVLSAGAALLRARRSAAFTRFDGNLAGLAVSSPADATTSATRLEAWAACPFGYLVQHVLRVQPVERPEDSLTISPLDRGSLVHEVLERFVVEVLSRPADRRPPPERPWDESDRAVLMGIAEEVCARYEAHGLVGRRIFWKRERRRILWDLDRFLTQDSAHRAGHGAAPLAAELPFGLPGAPLGPVTVPLPDGRGVRFRGKADRVDLCTDGSLEVVDYKTGSNRGFKDLGPDNPVDDGRKLQLPVYGLAARLLQGTPDAPVHSSYWFVTERGDFKRIGYDVTPAILGVLSATLGEVVAGIEAGVFPNRPTATSTSIFVDCHYCDPDGLGVADLVRQVEHKHDDPALARFLALTGGPTAGDTADAPGPAGPS